MKPSLSQSLLPRRAACLLAPAAAAFALLAAPAARADASYPQPSYKMQDGRMLCGAHLSMVVRPDGPDDQSIDLTWKGRHYVLMRKPTTTGAYHFDDSKTGLTMIQIPAKSMLFDNRNMTRLADDCHPEAGTTIAAGR